MTQPEPSNGRARSAQPVALGAQATGRAATVWQKIIAVLVIGYGLSIVGLCAWMVWQGDNEWLATLVLFGPRWVCAIPLPLLAVAAAIWYRRLLWVLAATAIVILFPFMGFKAHLPAPISTPMGFRVLTCNLAKKSNVIPSLAESVMACEPDIVALQEIDDPPHRYIWPEGWHFRVHDELALASRWPITEEERFSHPLSQLDIAGVHFRVQLPDREVHVFNLHLRSPRKGFEAVLNRRPAQGAVQLDAILEMRAIESEATANWIAGFDGPKIVLGDLNMPGESSIYRRDWTWLNDAFGKTGWGFGFTKISGEGYLAYGTRIDHVLYDESYSCVRCWVGGSVGSDHLPLFAEFR